MKRALRYLVAIPMLVVTACSNQGPPPRTPMPSNVPTTPAYQSTDAIVKKLAEKGINCKVIRSRKGAGTGGTADCVAELDGVTFQNDITVLSPERWTRDDVGDSIESRRTGLRPQTLVAAGQWYVRVREPRFAPRIAKALGGVVLPPKGQKIPKYDLPSIPAKPRYKTVDELADDLEAAVGCDDREHRTKNILTCTTGTTTGKTNCATLTLHPSTADRDATLREAIAYKGVPATLVTAANWTVNLCDYDLGEQVAKALGGTVVSYDGG